MLNAIIFEGYYLNYGKSNQHQTKSTCTLISDPDFKEDKNTPDASDVEIRRVEYLRSILCVVLMIFQHDD